MVFELEQAKRIRLLAMDVDGVLTDGRIILGGDSMEFKCFDVRDGMGIALARRAGIKTALITGRSSEAVWRRAHELHCDHCLQGVTDKKSALENLIRDEKITWDEVAYIGDDLNDLAPMAVVGLAVAVGHAAVEVEQAANYCCRAPGGRGAIRETVELILHAQGKWETMVDSMKEGTKKVDQ